MKRHATERGKNKMTIKERAAILRKLSKDKDKFDMKVIEDAKKI